MAVLSLFILILLHILIYQSSYNFSWSYMAKLDSVVESCYFVPEKCRQHFETMPQTGWLPSLFCHEHGIHIPL